MLYDLDSQTERRTSMSLALTWPVSSLPAAYSALILFSFSSSTMKNWRYLQATSTSRLAPARTNPGDCLYVWRSQIISQKPPAVVHVSTMSRLPMQTSSPTACSSPQPDSGLQAGMPTRRVGERTLVAVLRNGVAAVGEGVALYLVRYLV